MIHSRLIQRLRLRSRREPSSFWKPILGYQPQDDTLYELALTHRSAMRDSNERLEYLGDAVLSLAIGEAVYRTYPNATEGFLTSARARLVCREHLNQVAKHLELDKHMHIGRTFCDKTENVYGNALEALVGAIYLDAGYAECVRFIEKHITSSDMHTLKNVAEKEVDFKSRLLEWGKHTHHEVQFVLQDERYDRANDRHTFVYQVHIDGTARGEGAGSTKRQAQQVASRRALASL